MHSTRCLKDLSMNVCKSGLLFLTATWNSVICIYHHHMYLWGKDLGVYTDFIPKHCQIIPQNDISLCMHQQCMKVPLSPYLLQHLVLLNFISFANVLCLN